MKRQLVANYVGQSWTALMGLAFVPVYVSYLGLESYGLIGVYAILQAMLSLLDLGLTPAVGREMARFKAGAHSSISIKSLLRSIETVTVVIAALITGSIAFYSDWLAANWVKSVVLSTNTVANAFGLMGLVTGLRFVETIYRSSLLGLQRQVLFNVVYSVMATLRGLGAVAVLVFISPTLQAFFAWQVCVSLITLVCLAFLTYRSLPNDGAQGRFSATQLRKIATFSSGIVGVTLVSLVLTQTDKFLLSKYVTLSDFGVYTVAAAVAAGLYQLIHPVVQVFYPKLCELQAAGDSEGFTAHFHMGAQLIGVVAGTVAIILFFCSYQVLKLWTMDSSLAAEAAPLLSLLVLGNFLKGVTEMPYQAQLANGWTSLMLLANTCASAVLVPSMLFVVPKYGAIGSAYIWVALNSLLVLLLSYFMHRRILRGEGRRWFWQDFVLPVVPTGCLVYFGSLMISPLHGISLFLSLVTLSFVAAVTSILSSSLARKMLKSYLAKLVVNYRAS